jgi:pilus assembly protein TadC
MANINRSPVRTPAAPAAAPEPLYPPACPPPRVIAPPAPPRSSRARSSGRLGEEAVDEGLREQLVAAKEQRAPEGRSVNRTSWFYSLLFAGSFGAVMVGAIVLAIARSFGWAAVAVAVLLLITYAFVGGGPEWIAGRMRVRDRREIEEEVTLDMRDFDRPGPQDPE